MREAKEEEEKEEVDSTDMRMATLNIRKIMIIMGIVIILITHMKPDTQERTLTKKQCTAPSLSAKPVKTLLLSSAQS